MASQAIRFTVLDVGQGTGNFIETFDVPSPTPTTPPRRTILIDLGSEKKKTEAGGPSADWVVHQLKLQANAGRRATIDCLVLSHSDSDHINLLSLVLEAFDPPGTPAPTKPILEITTVFYGGDYRLYTKRTFNVLKLVEQYSPEDARPLSMDSSSFTTSRRDPMHVVDDVTLSLLIGNAMRPMPGAGPRKRPREEPADAFAINTRSLVVMVSWKEVQYIATGDATGVTMARTNALLTDAVRARYLSSVVMLTLPHHGSETTAFDITGRGGGRSDAAAVASVQLFAARTSPSSITASAERKRTFRHPSAHLIQQFWGSLGTGRFPNPALGGRHYYTAYFDTEDGYTVNSPAGPATPFPAMFPWWYSVQTSKDVYTNLYFDPLMVADTADRRTVVLPPTPGTWVDTPRGAPYPPLGVAWVYTSVAGGATTLTDLVNRPALVALRRRLETAAEARRSGATVGRTAALHGGFAPWARPPTGPPRTTHGPVEPVPSPSTPTSPGLARLRVRS